MSSSSAAKNAIVRSNKMIANVCVVNAGRLDFDGKLNLHSLSQALGLSKSSGGGGEDTNNLNENKNINALTAHQDSSPSPDVVAERSKGHNCIVTKEIEIDIDLLPTSVKLICEAGTGFNNIDIEKAKKRGIRVTNVPEYSTEAMSHLVITSILNSSASMIKQQKMLERNERAHFTNFSGLPHFELEGKKVGLIGGERNDRETRVRISESVSNETVRVFEVGKSENRVIRRLSVVRRVVIRIRLCERPLPTQRRHPRYARLRKVIADETDELFNQHRSRGDM